MSPWHPSFLSSKKLQQKLQPYPSLNLLQPSSWNFEIYYFQMIFCIILAISNQVTLEFASQFGLFHRRLFWPIQLGIFYFIFQNQIADGK